MCDTVAIVGGHELYTPAEVVEWFGFEILPGSCNQKSSPMTYPCLCGSDMDATFRANNIAYLYDGAGYIVGDREYLATLMKEYPDRYALKSFLP